MSRVVAGTEAYSNGPYLIPTDDDVGNDVFALLEDLLERIATHSHAGSDSQVISLNFSKQSEIYNVGVEIAWTPIGDGIHRAQVTIQNPPATFDDNLFQMFYNKGGTGWVSHKFRAQRIDATNYYVFSNDNTLDLKAVYF